MEAMRDKWTDERLDERATTVDGRFDRLEAHIDVRFAEVNARLESMNRSIIGAAISVVVALILRELLGG